MVTVGALRVRRRRLLPAVILGGLWPAWGGVAVAAGPAEVADLRYGVALYHYYQRDYLGALTELQVAAQRGGIVGHGVHPEVLRGSMQLAYGMRRGAAATFEAALARADSPASRDAAWFYLAKAHYRQGDWSGASDSLARIGPALAPDLQGEATAMRVSLALREGSTQRAETWRQQAPAGTWARYMDFNLGAAHARAGAPARSRPFFDRLIEAPTAGVEYEALRDRALTAAGYSQLDAGEGELALRYFRQVRAGSPLVEEALLGLGWAQAQGGGYRQALQSWQRLSRLAPLQQPVQEALLAVPFAYEKLGGPGEALAAFTRADQIYSAELDRTRRFRRRLAGEGFLAALEEQSVGWGGPDAPVPDQLHGLVDVLSSAEFQAYKRDMADLSQLRDVLALGRRNLLVYRDLLQRRGTRRGAQLDQLGSEDYPRRWQDLRDRRDALAARLARVEDSRDWLALADEPLHGLWQRQQRAAARLDRLRAAGQPVDPESQWLARYRGLLLWEASEASSASRWQARKGLKAVDAGLRDVARGVGAVQGIAATNPDIRPFVRRIGQLERRLARQAEGLQLAAQRVEATFRDELLLALDEHEERLLRYQARARTARARLSDLARQGAGR